MSTSLNIHNAAKLTASPGRATDTKWLSIEARDSEGNLIALQNIYLPEYGACRRIANAINREFADDTPVQLEAAE